MSSRGPLTYDDAINLADIVRAAQQKLPVARTVPGGTYRGVAQSITRHPHEPDVRAGWLDVVDNDGPIAWGVGELLEDAKAERFLVGPFD